MVSRLPPLNALKALESAGRYVSFCRAADELHVTPGAISRQIRGLEDLLGFPLFERHHREVRLTAESKAYVESLSDAFNQMERATRRLIDSRKQNFIHVHSAITFTMRWLVPKLVAFHALYPKREIRTSTMLPGAADLSALPTDVTIQISDPEQVERLAPALIAHPLVEIDLVPVCSPQFHREHDLGKHPHKLKDLTRLISSARLQDWGTWADAAALDFDPMVGVRFESSSLAYHAAIEGMGVAMAMKRLVQDDLEAGRLVPAHKLVHPTGHAFHLFYSQAAAQMPQIKEFRDWITGVARH
jgi:LysR family glycine cleavage system transcriptional activator